MSFVPLGHADDLWDGELRAVMVDGRPLLVLRVDGEVRVYEDRCCHLGQRLGDGSLKGRVLSCAAHGWQYDAATGAGLNPRGAGLRPWTVRIEAGVIQVEAPP